MFADNFLGDLAISDKMSGFVWIISSVQNYDEYEVLLRTYVDTRHNGKGLIADVVWMWVGFSLGVLLGLLGECKSIRGFVTQIPQKPLATWILQYNKLCIFRAFLKFISTYMTATLQ